MKAQHEDKTGTRSTAARSTSPTDCEHCHQQVASCGHPVRTGRLLSPGDPGYWGNLIPPQPDPAEVALPYSDELRAADAEVAQAHAALVEATVAFSQAQADVSRATGAVAWWTDGTMTTVRPDDEMRKRLPELRRTQHEREAVYKAAREQHGDVLLRRNTLALELEARRQEWRRSEHLAAQAARAATAKPPEPRRFVFGPQDLGPN